MLADVNCICRRQLFLFSYFIACGHYEAVYILDALQLNASDLQPRRVHADTHGQCAAVFGLAYLLGIELMPRIRSGRSSRSIKPAANTTTGQSRRCDGWGA